MNGVAFDVALLTNLSRDHLDYHGDMENYARAKAGLFAWKGLKHAVVNLDDPFGMGLAESIDGSKVNVVGYGFGKGEVSGRNLKLSEDGLELDLQTAWGNGHIKSKLLGAFNASNLMGVLATLLVSNVPFEAALQELADVMPVMGRMERLGGGDKPLVIVDYAHTPDALEKVLTTLREVISRSTNEQAKLICVFGCGGDRDKGKRPMMGAVATRLSDSVVVTSDNPRGEKPRDIIDEIIAGVDANYHVMEDRAEAIYQAVREARKGDVVLIAGKGHEQYQDINGVKLPFSDVEVANRALQDALH